MTTTASLRIITSEKGIENDVRLLRILDRTLQGLQDHGFCSFSIRSTSTEVAILLSSEMNDAYEFIGGIIEAIEPIAPHWTFIRT